ncbi:MAG: hypothetical protein QNJ72_24915 [Pleurocapsa sp. MO_226.B13]|nr:hypothetical protein [Pleurocapsa sp. MO_226.B13]
MTRQQINFNLYNLDFILDTGINLFKQDEIETVSNVPLYLSWETKLGKIDLTITDGVDFFDHLLPRVLNEIWGVKMVIFLPQIL